jgi:hypothetical protein
MTGALALIEAIAAAGAQAAPSVHSLQELLAVGSSGDCNVY